MNMSLPVHGVTVALGANASVELRAASKRFGDVVALDDISLIIGRGEFFSLLGPSGCGKSTTLNLIGGFEAPSSGDILIEGRSVADVPPYERPVNTVFQSYALFPHMTVTENVEFGLRMKGVERTKRRAAAVDMLRMVSLAGFENRRPGQLSGGQRQRVALARALVNHPSVLLLDEPLGALDLKLRKQMQGELTRLQRQVGITFVYVTHDQEEAMAMSDRIGVMNGGRLLQVGSPAEIYDNPAHRFVMEFIGAANVLVGRLVNVVADIGEVEIEGLGRMRGRTAGQLAPGARVALLIRPEKIRFDDNPSKGNAGATGLPGCLVHASHLGFLTHYSVRLANGTDLLCYRLSETVTVPPAQGALLTLTWDEADARIFPAEADNP
ncbi:MAG: ABC transporter ATP-binding protein [Hyphomicrobiaceae bacterium]